MNLIQLENNRKYIDDTAEIVSRTLRVCMDIGGGLLAIILGVLIYPFIVVLLYFLLNRALKMQQKSLTDLETFEFGTAEEYDKLLEIYYAVKDKSKEAEQLIYKYNSMKKGVPFLLKLLIDPAVRLISLDVEVINKIAEILCLRPKGVTAEQIQEAASLNEGLEHMFDDNDEDYIEYAKEIALEHLEYKG